MMHVAQRRTEGEMDESWVGWEGEPFVLPVEKGKIREFARATKSRHPDHFDGEHPVIPPTFLQVALFWEGEGSTPWSAAPRNLDRALHGAEEIVFHGEPPRAGDVLTGRMRVDRIYRKSGRRGGDMEFVETVTEFRDDSGHLVAEVRRTSIETSRPTVSAG